MDTVTTIFDALFAFQLQPVVAMGVPAPPVAPTTLLI